MENPQTAAPNEFWQYNFNNSVRQCHIQVEVFAIKYIKCRKITLYVIIVK